MRNQSKDSSPASDLSEAAAGEIADQVVDLAAMDDNASLPLTEREAALEQARSDLEELLTQTRHRIAELNSMLETKTAQLLDAVGERDSLHQKYQQLERDRAEAVAVVETDLETVTQELKTAAEERDRFAEEVQRLRSSMSPGQLRRHDADGPAGMLSRWWYGP